MPRDKPAVIALISSGMPDLLSHPHRMRPATSRRSSSAASATARARTVEHISAASDRTALRSAQSGPSLDPMGRPHTNGLIPQDLAWTLSPAWHDRERTTAISGVLTALATRAGRGPAARMRRGAKLGLAAVVTITTAPCPRSAGQSLPGLAPTAIRVEVDRNQAPWAALGRVQTEFSERCTGFQLAPALVATAAHCFYLPKVARFIRPHEIHFLLGEHLDTYVDHARAVHLDVAPGYQPVDEAATARLDRAFITLDHPTQGLVLRIATTMPSPGTRLMLGGYGQDRQERILADTACHLLAFNGGLIRHDCAATRGTSGAPLLAWETGAWRVIGIQIEAELNGQGGVAASLVPRSEATTRR